MSTIKLTFYGTGDEAYELWQAGYILYYKLADDSSAKYMRKLLLNWLKKGAELSRKDYVEYFGDPDDKHADKVTVEVRDMK
jgi:hypothetical protein